MDVRIVNAGQNQGPIYSAHVKNLNRSDALAVVQVNVSGDIVNPGGAAGAGGDGAILDGVDSGIKASVKSTAGAKPLHVIITNISGDTPNLPSSNPDGAIVDGADSNIKATVKDYANSNPLAVALVNASGDVYNGNQTSVSVNKWNLVPAEDSVNVHSGKIGVTGDVSTTPKSGSTWPVSLASDINTREQSKIGVQIVGGAIGGTVGISGDTIGARQSGAWSMAISGDVLLRANAGTDIGNVGIKAGQTIAVTATDLDIRPLDPSQDSVRIHGGQIGVSGDVLLRANTGVDIGNVGIKSGQSINVNEQQKIGVHVAGGLAGITGDVNVVPGLSPVFGRYVPISGDTGIRDGVDPTIKANVRDYANSNPLAVVLTNFSGDTYNPVPKSPIILTVAGRLASAGSTSIVGAVAGKKIKVVDYNLQGDGDNARGFFASGASGTQLTPEWELASREGVVKQVSAIGGGYIFSTTAGAALSFESSSLRGMKYSVGYYTDDAL